MITRMHRVTCATAALVASTAVNGQPAPQPRNTTVNVNYEYAALLGFGGYSIGGLSANVYQLPLSDTLEDLPFKGWALRFMLPIQLGIYNFRASDEGRKLSLNQQSLALVPGVELQIPITDRFVVKPFVQGGAGHAFGLDSGNPDAWIYLAGVRSVAQWRDNDYTFSLGNGIVYAGDDTIGPGAGNHYVSLQIAGEVRRPVGFKIGNFAPDLGLYVAEYYYPTPLVFSRFLQSPLQVHNQNEVGFSIGSAEPLKILWLSNPRIGAGIVFGGGLTVYHINFGFPF